MNIEYITEISDKRMELFQLPEVQLLRYYEPKPGLFVAETAKVIARALAADYEPLCFLAEPKMLTDHEATGIFDRCKETPIYVAELSVMTEITGYGLTHGLLCVFRRKCGQTLESFCADKKRIAILEDVVNPTNVGAIFRSAAAMHMDGVILTAGCSNPLYRRAARVSMGTVFQIPWIIMDKKLDWPGEGTKLLKNQGFSLVALALKENSISIQEPVLKEKQKLAVLLGTEGEGLRTETIAACDYNVIIPMSHEVDSLNVAAASAVAFWELGNK